MSFDSPDPPAPPPLPPAPPAPIEPEIDLEDAANTRRILDSKRRGRDSLIVEPGRASAGGTGTGLRIG